MSGQWDAPFPHDLDGDETSAAWQRECDLYNWESATKLLDNIIETMYKYGTSTTDYCLLKYTIFALILEITYFVIVRVATVWEKYYDFGSSYLAISYCMKLTKKGFSPILVQILNTVKPKTTNCLW